MLDCEIRPLLKQRIAAQFASCKDMAIIEELLICDRSARVDVAVANGHLHGYEIKGSQDTLDRLPSQVEYYSRVFQFCTLVAAERHLKNAQRILPPWWGQIAAESISCASMPFIAKPKLNPNIDPLSVCWLLIGQELRLILKEEGLVRRGEKRCPLALRLYLAEAVRPKKLLAYANRFLKIRATKRLLESQIPCDGLLPHESTAMDFQVTLDWLLAVESASLPD